MKLPVTVLLAVLVGAASLVAAETSVLVAFTNDRHGYLEPYPHPVTGRPIGGIAHEATLLQAIRQAAGKEKTPLLLVDAGDLFQGTPVVNATEGKCMIDLYNQLGYHLVTFGNHEFDYGQDVLRQRMTESRFIWVSSNVEAPKLAGAFVPYVTYELAGTKLAFLAVTTPTTPSITYPKNTTGMTFREPRDVLPPLIDRLRRDHGVKVFVLLSHLGFQADEWLARRMAGIDLIIGGHSHTRLLEPVRVNGTWIVQAGSNSRYVGVARLSMGDDGLVKTVTACLREVDHSLYGPDEAVRTLLRSFTDQLAANLDDVAGTASEAIERGFVGADSPMGVVCADSYRDATGAEVGVMNVGGVRAGLEAGPVTVRQLMLVSPFSNTVVHMRMKGRDLRALVERSLGGVWHDIPADKQEQMEEEGQPVVTGKIPEKRTVGFLVFAGMTYAFDATKPQERRLLDIRVAGAPLENERLYTVAMNSFLAFGGDGFSEFKNGVDVVETEMTDIQALCQYFQKRGTVAPPAFVAADNVTLQVATPERN